MINSDNGNQGVQESTNFSEYSEPKGMNHLTHKRYC